MARRVLLLKVRLKESADNFQEPAMISALPQKTSTSGTTWLGVDNQTMWRSMISSAQVLPTVSHCECGQDLTYEEAMFWGECRSCQSLMPIRTSQNGDTKTSCGEADRQFHGGRGRSGEW